MTMSRDGTPLPQGDLRLLETATATRLLALSIPARVAYVAIHGTPRIVPTWFHWTGHELVMPTFVSAPHVRHGAGRLRALRARPDVAITMRFWTGAPRLTWLNAVGAVGGVGSFIDDP